MVLMGCFYFLSRPDLFSFFAQQLQTTDVLASHRVTMVLFRTLKELSTKRLSADTRTFSQVKAIKKKHRERRTKKELLTN